MDDKTKEFWKKYEDKWGPVDTELYDVSESIYVHAKTKIEYKYVQYGTFHEQSPNNLLTGGLLQTPRNAVNRTVFFWKQYEEKHGPVDTELYSVFESYYLKSTDKLVYLYNKNKTKHAKRFMDALQNGLSHDINTAIDKKEFFWKQYEEKWGPVDTELYDVSNFVYENSRSKLDYIYKPFGTKHNKTFSVLLAQGINASLINAYNPTKFFWKQYEEKWGPIDTDLYDVSDFVYEKSSDLIKYIYKPYGTFHKTKATIVLNNGLKEDFKNSEDPTYFFWKKYEEKHGPVDTELYDVSEWIYPNKTINIINVKYKTKHTQFYKNVMSQGIGVDINNSLNKDKFFWKQYEEKHGPVDNELYDVSGFVYKGSDNLIKYIYKPYGTIHTQKVIKVLHRGISQTIKNSENPTDFFWKQYEEKHGLVDTDLFDVSNFKYNSIREQVVYLSKIHKTKHSQEAMTILNRGLLPIFSNSVDKKDYLLKRWASKSELVNYVKKAFEYIKENSKGKLASETETDNLYREYYNQNTIDNIPHSLEKIESVYGVGGLMDQHGLKENVFEL